MGPHVLRPLFCLAPRMPSSLAVPHQGLFFDGQRWAPRDRSPVRQAPRVPQEFNIADDDDGCTQIPEEATTLPHMSLGRAAQRGFFGCRRAKSAAALAALSCLVLVALAQTMLLVPRLPDPDGSGVHPPLVFTSLAIDDKVDSASVVRWHGLVPECPAERFVVGARPVKLRVSAAKDSEAVALLSSGTVVRRVGRCENHAGLVRVLIAAPGSAATPLGDVPVVRTDRPGVHSMETHEVRGWATLTAEFVQGPRFLEPVSA